MLAATNHDVWYTMAFKLVGHTKPINCMAFSPGGRYLATGDDEGTVILWEVKRGRMVEALTTTFHGAVSDVVWLSVLQGIIVGYADGSVKLWARDKKTVHFINRWTLRISEDSQVDTIALCETTLTLAVSYRSALVFIDLTNIDSPYVHQGIELASRPIASQFCDGDGRLLVAHLESHELSTWDAERRELIDAVLLNSRIGHFVWSAERHLFLVCNLHNGVDLYQNLETPIFIRTIPVISRTLCIRQSAFAASGHYAVSGGDDGKVMVWRTGDGNITQTLQHQEGRTVQIVKTTVSAEGVHLLATGCDGMHPSVKLWVSASHLPEWRYPSQRFMVASMFGILVMTIVVLAKSSGVSIVLQY